MPEGVRDWREHIDDVDAALVDGYQSGFPVTERPFYAIAAQLETTEDDVLARLDDLYDAGIVRRFGAVLNPPVIGSSTLAAVKAPLAEYDEIAGVVNSYRQVNHNYRRDHEWNMWFVVTAASKEKRDEILADIEARTGCDVLNLPMLTDYYIDLEFPVVNRDRFARETTAKQASPDERVARDAERPSDDSNGPSARENTGDPRARESLEETEVSATRISEQAAGDVSDLDARILLEIQDGFPLTKTPYADIATTVGADVDDVLESIERLLEDGCIKRIGCVVNHVVTGFDANCMVVWDVPDDELDDRGELVGALPYVTLCYHRPRRPDQDWQYNLFTMIHGREASAVDEKIDELAADYLPFDHERLYSLETLKQTGARYEELVGTR